VVSEAYVVTILKESSIGISLGLGKCTKTLNQDGQFHGRDLNPVPVKCEAFHSDVSSHVFLSRRLLLQIRGYVIIYLF
jgi:hypothetical protein